MEEDVSPKIPKAKYLKHPSTGEVFPYSDAIAINTFLIPTDEQPEWAKEAKTVKKGAFGRPIKTDEPKTEE